MPDAFEVPAPILNSPFDEPAEHWHIVEGETPEKRPGRRPAVYYYRDPKQAPRDSREANSGGVAVELPVVNQIRERVKAWRTAGYPGVTRTTLELLQWWQREGRDERKRLFFAQKEAAETVIFLTEARADFRQGIAIPMDEPSDDQKVQGITAFRRLACKMATGSGKTTVMGMLSAWTILNKVNDRGDGRFSDVVLIVCPNVTIRDRLRELDPENGDASLFRPASRRPRSMDFATATGRSTRFAWIPKSFTKPIPAKRRTRRKNGCGSRSTRWASSPGRPTVKAGQSIRRTSRNWRRRWSGRCIRRAATFVVSSALEC